MKNIVLNQLRMMNKKSIHWLIYLSIWIAALIGLSGTLPLLKNELINGNICPRILSVPACYIIFSSIILIIISHSQLFSDRNRLYYLGVFVALSIATFGSVGNLLGYVECPQTEGGIPMCYLSFLLFFSLLSLKLIENQLK